MYRVGHVPKRLCPEVAMSRNGYVPKWLCPETVMSRSGYVPKRSCPEVAMSRNGHVPKCPTFVDNRGLGQLTNGNNLFFKLVQHTKYRYIRDTCIHLLNVQRIKTDKTDKSQVICELLEENQGAEKYRHFPRSLTFAIFLC